MGKVGFVQLGKNGLTESFIGTLKDHFKICRVVKISVLKSARENKKDVKKYAEEIEKKLGGNYKTKVIGFVVVVKKLRNTP